jgi:NAD+ synthase (glutamine-hydrolysing)
VAGGLPRECAHGIPAGGDPALAEVFLKRFFANQFKRSALPNGPKVVRGGSLSPRGDWRMPSDASARVWLAELEAHVPASWPNS